jgi:hypothetical protein
VVHNLLLGPISQNQQGAKKGRAVENIEMKLPVVTLSSSLLQSGEIEERFLTPLGSLSVCVRHVPGNRDQSPQIEIRVDGDTTVHWAAYISEIESFRTALLDFIEEVCGGSLSVDPEWRSRNLSIEVRDDQVIRIQLSPLPKLSPS